MLMVNKHLYSQSYSRFGIEASEDNIPEGLTVNSIAPDFIAKNQYSKEILLYDILKKQKVVLFFYRGNWCPFCNVYLRDMQDSLHLILDKNAAVIAVSPESTENLQHTVNKYQLGFNVIHDPDNRIMKAYKVLFNVTGFYRTKIKVGEFINLAEFNDQDKARLPVPATYVIDNDKRIVYAYFNIDFRYRAPVSEILKHL